MLSLLELSLTGGVFIPRRGCGTGAGHEPAAPAGLSSALGRGPGPPASPLLHSLPHQPLLRRRTSGRGLPAGRASSPPEAQMRRGPQRREAVIPWMALLWAAGALACALCFLPPHLRGRREWNASLPVEDPFVTAWLDGHPIRRRVRVRCSDRVDSPLTYGLLRPVIPPAQNAGPERRVPAGLRAHPRDGPHTPV